MLKWTNMYYDTHTSQQIHEHNCDDQIYPSRKWEHLVKQTWRWWNKHDFYEIMMKHNMPIMIKTNNQNMFTMRNEYWWIMLCYVMCKDLMKMIWFDCLVMFWGMLMKNTYKERAWWLLRTDIQNDNCCQKCKNMRNLNRQCSWNEGVSSKHTFFQFVML